MNTIQTTLVKDDKGNCYDYSTKNTSMIQLSHWLHAQGVRGYQDPLLLLDEDLYGVDPYDVFLPYKMQRKVIKECENNIFYFIREIVREKDKDGKYTLLKLHKSTFAQIWAMLSDIDSVSYIPKAYRQMELMILWKFLFGQFFASYYIYCKSAGVKTDTYNNLISYIHSVPDYFSTDCISKDKSIITHAIRKNCIQITTKPIDTVFLTEQPYLKDYQDSNIERVLVYCVKGGIKPGCIHADYMENHKTRGAIPLHTISPIVYTAKMYDNPEYTLCDFRKSPVRIQYNMIDLMNNIEEFYQVCLQTGRKPSYIKKNYLMITSEDTIISNHMKSILEQMYYILGYQRYEVIRELNTYRITL